MPKDTLVAVDLAKNVFAVALSLSAGAGGQAATPSSFQVPRILSPGQRTAAFGYVRSNAGACDGSHNGRCPPRPAAVRSTSL